MLSEVAGSPGSSRAAEDGGRELAERRHSTIALSLGTFAVLYVLLAVVDFVLMRHYASLDPPPAGATGTRRRRRWGTDGPRALLFCLVAFFWRATSCSRASTSGWGCCCRSCRGTSANDGSCSRRSARSGTRTRCGSSSPAPRLRRLPGWYGTMFSGLYLALLLVLVLLIVRVVSSSAREAGEPRWRASWMWANTIEEPEPRHRGGAWRTSCTASRSTPTATSPGASGSLQPVHRLRRAGGGAPLRLSRRHVPDAPNDRRPVERARHASRRLALPPRSSRESSSSGRSQSPSTATTRTCSHRSFQPPPESSPSSSRSPSPSPAGAEGRSR